MTSWASPTDGPSASAFPGMRLGNRYILNDPIAAGGMAQVWAATDTVLDRKVAVKILHPHLATDEAFIERFRREAVAAARLSHSAIVSVFDTISADGIEAIVMELIEGKTLRTVLDEVGALSAADVVHLGIQIANALDEAHRAGIVHRDIKPANIMVCPDRRVLVTDFGIAKAGTDADLTATGTLLGTAKYLAPEQVEGADIDPRSDLYSLGVVMFEALTGTAPFKANTDAATALARLHQPAPPVRQLRPNVSPELAAVVAKLMARNPDDRYHRALALDEALSNLGSPTASEDDGPPPSAPGETLLMRPGGQSGSPATGQAGGQTNIARAAAITGQPPSGQVPEVSSRAGQWAPPSHPRPPDPPSSLVAGPPLAPSAAAGASSRPATNGGGFEVLGVDDGSGRNELSAERVVRSGRSRVVPLIVVALAVVGLVVAGALLTDVEIPGMTAGADGPANPFDETSPGLAIVDLTSFDPQTSDADKQEREDLVDFAADGDLSTSWMTESYRRRGLGGLKTGVGLLIRLEQPLPLNQVVLDTNTEGWVAEIYVGVEFSPDGSNWGEPVATVEAGSNRVVRDLGRAEGSTVLLWINDTGVSGERFRFELAEIVVR